MVASHAAVARSIPAEVALIYTMPEALDQGVLPKVYISTGIPTRVVGTCFCGEAREADSNLPI